MTEGGEGERAHLDGLAYRMLAGVLLLGAGVLLLLLIVLLALPRIETAEGALVLLPGTRERHGLSAVALPVLGAATLVLGFPGLLALWLGRRQARFGHMSPTTAGARSLLRPGLVFLTGAALLTFVMLRR